MKAVHFWRLQVVYFWMFSFCFLLGCSYFPKKKDNKNRDYLILAALVYQSQTKEESYSCDTNSPTTFSTVKKAFENAPNPCINCHSSDTKLGNLDVMDYNLLLTKVEKGKPEGSVLFQKMKTGSMEIYSDAKTREAVFCWILGGARN